MNRRSVASLLLVVSILLLLVQPLYAEGDTVTIASKADWIEFTNRCTLDSWSRGKTVVLTCDIELNNESFTPVATFGGSFEGNGHTISGVKLTGKGSYMGLFRYIQAGGTVSDLHVEGSVVPGGSKSFVGGIAGENAGTIEQCSFHGTVKGENVVGAIAGQNTASGRITACSAKGSVSGENSTGGIVGKNDGLLLGCSNYAEVNTAYEEKKREITDLETDAGAFVETLQTSREEREEESLLGHSDTGGIAGYSGGIVQGCHNEAPIGYPHIGYNVGGIVGRQSGYLLGCTNSGTVQGRKDVGGIAGQAEPYLILNTSESSLEQVRVEFDKLQTMLERMADDTDALGDDTERHLTALSDYAENARLNTEELINQGTGFIDDNLAEINAQAAILSNTLDKLDPVFASMEDGVADIVAAMEALGGVLDELDLDVPNLQTEISAIQSAMLTISKSESSIQRAVTRAARAANALGEMVVFKNRRQVENASQEISDAVDAIISGRKEIQAALETIENSLKINADGFAGLGVRVEDIAAAIGSIRETNQTMLGSLQAIADGVRTIVRNTQIDLSTLKTAAQNMESSIVALGGAAEAITKGIKDLANGIGALTNRATEYGNSVDAELDEATAGLSAACTSLSNAAQDLSDSIRDLRSVISDLAAEEPLSFVALDEPFRNASDALFGSISDISSEMQNLKTVIADGSDRTTAQIRAIGDQIQVIMNLLIGEMETLQDMSGSATEIFVDVSDDDILNTKQGKVQECCNYAAIEGDRNTGGIVGAMAIEYAKDPEDDMEKPTTLRFTYQTKAIVQGCINHGTVTAKKDCSGGIIGLSELGTVYECENYAETTSTGGDYVGGVAGKSSATVRKSYAKCRVAGGRYVGGIAGKASALRACYALGAIEGEESIGSICGAVENRAKLENNFFIDSDLGAIDGISYEGQAAPMRFEELQAIDAIPARFIGFLVTFLADDQVLATQQLRYGASIDEIKYPAIPEKEGQFGTWQTPKSETIREDLQIQCQYQPYQTVLASEEKNESGTLALALAEGLFTDRATLHVTKSEAVPPSAASEGSAVYDIALDLEQNETVTLRLLNENKAKVTVWNLVDGAWEKLDATPRGKYVLVRDMGAETTICIQYMGPSFPYLWLLPVVLLIGAVWFFIHRKRKKRLQPHL